MTKQEAVERAGLANASFDYALPQDWVDEMFAHIRCYPGVKFSYDEIVSNIIWLYDDKAPLFGRPFPITFIGKSILRRLSISF